MLHAKLGINLPSTPYPTSNRLASLLRKLLNDPDPHEGRKRTLVNGLSILEMLIAACDAAGFDDVISISVGGKSIYVDTLQRIGDLQIAVEHTLSCGALKDGLTNVQLVLSKRDSALHTLIEVNLNEEVLLKEEEIAVEWVTRISGLRVHSERNEDPTQYYQRVASSLTSTEFEREFENCSKQFRDFRENIQQKLSPTQIREEPLVARVVVPGPTQVGRFRHLQFRTYVRRQVYRPEKKKQRIGAYDNPHVYYYFDPYHDLLCWILVQEAISGRWPATNVEFLHVNGKVLGVGGQMLANVDLDVSHDLVQFGENCIHVADQIPFVGLDPNEIGSPHTPGWGGGN